MSFLVAKWAYFNYYYIPAVLLMLAIAGNNLPLDRPEMMQPPALVRIGAAWWRTNGTAAAPPTPRARRGDACPP